MHTGVFDLAEVQHVLAISHLLVLPSAFRYGVDL